MVKVLTTRKKKLFLVEIILQYIQILNHYIPETNVVCQLYHNNNNLVWKIKCKIVDVKFLES